MASLNLQRQYVCTLLPLSRNFVRSFSCCKCLSIQQPLLRWKCKTSTVKSLIFDHENTRRLSNNINSNDDARKLLASLPDDVKQMLIEEIRKDEEENDLKGFGKHAPIVQRKADGHSKKPTRLKATPPPSGLLKQAFYFHGVPFIGFGFMDNLLMILAGDYIDLTLGVTLGISTLAAAALGNIVSDVVGIGFSGYIEKFSHMMGFNAPELTAEQAVHWKTRYIIALGRSIGITIGCLIGMLPLLFMDTDHQKLKESQNCVDQGTNT